jgi:hypothetical protein
MKLKPNDFRKIVIGSFLAVPFLSSLISTIHIITFFGLGNMSWMAIILSLAFEIGSIASLMTLTVLDKVNRFAVWFIFFVLVVMQMLGNVYYTYDFISNAMISNPQWIDSFIDLVEMMTMQKLEQRTTKFILSLLIGLPIPVISLAFLKSVSDYLKPESNLNPPIENKEVVDIEEVKEDSKLETITENSEDIKEEDIEKYLKPTVNTEINNQITDSVTQVMETNEEIEKQEVEELIENPLVQNEINPDSIEESFENITDHRESVDLVNGDNVFEEIEPESSLIEETIEEIEEVKSDIYEENIGEPEDSFFDDSTIEEEFDNFQENKDDEKKSL